MVKFIKGLFASPAFPIGVCALGISNIILMTWAKWVQTQNWIYPAITVGALALFALGLYGIYLRFSHMFKDDKDDNDGK